MKKVKKLKQGDKVAVLSPSFAAPGKFPHVYELGLKRLREVFGLIPVEYPTTKKIGASTEERSRDLITAFEDDTVKAIIATIGGDDQVTYVSKLPNEPFANHPKLFFGYSDNSHFCNFLFRNGVPSFYGACLMTQFAMQKEMDEYSVSYIKHALFEEGEFELRASQEFNEIGLDWNDESLLNTRRNYEKSDGWYWDGEKDATGILWGGCLESIDDMLRHQVELPSMSAFEDIVIFFETSEEIPSQGYVHRVLRALGERGILKRVKGVLFGRPKAWEFDKQYSPAERDEYRKQQREVVLSTIRAYNSDIPVIQNMNFGHTDPQIPLPYGGRVRIDREQRVFANF